jgi:type I protein arginine methyltransferase
MQAVRIPASAAFVSDSDSCADDASESSSEIDDTGDQAWEDWVETDTLPCLSLFDDRVLPSAADALQYDSTTYRFDYQAQCGKLGIYHILDHSSLPVAFCAAVLLRVVD